MKNERSTRRIVLVLLVLAVGACGHDPSSGGEDARDGEDSVTADSDADAEADADAEEEAHPEAEDPADVPLTDNELLVSAGAFVPLATTNLVAINVVAAPGERCRVERVEGCRVIDCGWSTPDPPSPTFDAGRIDLLVDGLATLSVEPDPTTGAYGGDDSPGLLHSPGDVVAFRATGGDVPAFTRDVTVPDAATVLSPPEPMTMIRSEPFAVTWVPFDGLVTVSGNQAPPGTAGVSVGRYFICDVDANLGTYSVPPSVLDVLGPGNAWLNICGVAPVDLVVGAYAVHLMVVTCGSAHSATVE
ncbi:MAG: hypothetical protein JXB32_05010 [Deltaproteobacteria bacterium]|nr:hypothetical protein [Deltaproteobacteria bacterium]